MHGQKNLRNVKIGFLIFVGVLVAIALFYSFKNDNVDEADEKTKDIDDEVVSQDEQIDSNELKEIEEKYNNNTNQETNNDKKQKDVSKDEEVESYDFASFFYEKFGKEKVAHAEEVTEKVVKMYINEDNDWDEWKKYVDKNLLKKMKNEVQVSQDNVERKIDVLQVYAVGNEKGSDIKFEVDVRWYLQRDGNIFDKKGGLVYVTLDVKNNKPVVTDFQFL